MKFLQIVAVALSRFIIISKALLSVISMILDLDGKSREVSKTKSLEIVFLFVSYVFFLEEFLEEPF